MDAGRPPLAARPKLTAPSATSSATSQARSGCGPVAISGPQLLGQVALEKDEHGGDSKIASNSLSEFLQEKRLLSAAWGRSMVVPPLQVSARSAVTSRPAIAQPGGGCENVQDT